MTPLTLYGARGSGSAAVEAALVLAGIAHRCVEAPPWGDNAAALAELTRLNPLQQIPTLLLPDGSVLTESAAILIHLGLTHPASGLLPAEPGARAQALRGLVYIPANCYSAITIIDYPERFCLDATDAERERVRAAARRRLHHCWGLFADTFTGAPFLGGAQPGALDLLATVVSRWSGTRPYLNEHKPALHAVVTAVDAWPAVAAVFERHWPARG